MLHICQDFLTKKCSKTEDICGLNHETAPGSKQAERIVKEFHFAYEQTTKSTVT